MQTVLNFKNIGQKMILLPVNSYCGQYSFPEQPCSWCDIRYPRWSLIQPIARPFTEPFIEPFNDPFTEPFTEPFNDPFTEPFTEPIQRSFLPRSQYPSFYCRCLENFYKTNPPTIE